jgi:hypothetical protein
MRKHGKPKDRKRQAQLRELLETDDLYFFEASTHPPGDPILAGGKT